MLRAKLLDRDIRMHLYETGVVKAYDHLVLLAHYAARSFNIFLTLEGVYAAEALLLDHPDINDEKDKVKQKNKLIASLMWIAARPAGYFTTTRPLQLKMDGFPLGIPLM